MKYIILASTFIALSSFAGEWKDKEAKVIKEHHKPEMSKNSDKKMTENKKADSREPASIQKYPITDPEHPSFMGFTAY